MSKARQLADLGNVYDDGALSNRNLIINGAMQVAQRGTSSTTTSGGYYVTDRWTNYTSAGSISIEQSTDAPDGFANSLKNTMTTASSGAVWIVQQHIEGHNSTQLSFGSSGAKDITLSFWVKSSVTGKFAGHFGNNNAGGSYRVLVFTYTINSANTWEYKTVTVSGDTSGTWNADQNTGIKVLFNLGTGGSTATENVWQTADAVRTSDAVGIEGTLNATWQITGVQLEVGDTATPFEHRSYGDELARCQRYFERIGGNSNYDPIGVGHQRSATESYFHVSFKEMKRAAPSVSFTNNVITTDRLNFDQVVSSIGVSEPSVHGFHGNFNHSSVGATYRPIMITSGPNTPFGYMDFDAEL